MSGIERIEHIASQLDDSLLEEAANHLRGRCAATQPWLILGISDGMGLQTAIAAIKSGVLKHAIGVYWEPPHLLEKKEDGSPLSPLHHARVENAEALIEYAKAHGASFEVLFENVILAPQRDLKGNEKEPAPAFPETIKNAVNTLRKTTKNKDVIFVNSVAFGKWISPRKGQEAITVASIDLQGRLVQTKTKKFHARGYEETLDTMGRNHKKLLDAISGFGWLGEDSLSSFYTWAGGSQNIDVLEGIYGKGALGDAKMIAEQDIAKFRIDHGTTFGAHAIVRLPAFLSAALMGIPGGGLFGVISRSFLEEKGLFEDMPMLVSRLTERVFGEAWLRENPISQVELDMAECLYIKEIQERLKEVHQRIADYRASLPAEKTDDRIEIEKTCELLRGFVDPTYPALLAKFDPDAPLTSPVTSKPKKAATTNMAIIESIQPDENGEASFELSLTELGGAGKIPRPDLTLVAVIRRLDRSVIEKFHVFSPRSETLTIESALPTDGKITVKIRVIQGHSSMHLSREYFAESGKRIAFGEAHFVDALRATGSVSPEDNLLGDAIGYRMPVREPLQNIYSDATDEKVKLALYGPALISFTQRSLVSHGFFDEKLLPHTWNMRFGPEVEIGDHLLTYARREQEGIVITVVNDDSSPTLQIRLSR